MRSDLATGTGLAVLYFSLSSLLAAPGITAADGDAVGHTAELIRLHQEATSPLLTIPAEAQDPGSLTCERPDDPATNEQATSIPDAGNDAPTTRPTGKRSKRIEA